MAQVGAPAGHPKRARRLRTALFRSHMLIAALGGIMLAVAVGAVYTMVSTAEQLSTRSGPAVAAALRLAEGLQTSLAALHGWVTVPDETYKRGRQAAWDKEIDPSLVILSSLSAEGSAEEARDLRELEAILADLKEWQWHVEQVAHTPGNHPGWLVADREAAPVAREIRAALDSALQIQRNAEGPSIKQIYIGLSEIQAALGQAQTALQSALVVAPGRHTAVFFESMERARSMLAELRGREGIDPGLATLADILRRDLIAYERLGQEAIDLATGAEANVAHRLLMQEAAPLSRTAEDVIARIVETNRARMASDVSEVAAVGRAGVLVLVCLIAAMLVIAAWLAQSRAEDIAAPMAALADASRRLAAGELDEDLPMRGADEVRRTTEAFNTMRSALVQGRQALERTNHELATQNRRRAALAQLDEAIRGHLTTRELGERALSFLAAETHAVVGALYLRRGETMRWVAGYAHGDPDRPPPDFAMGQGLVGQAAADGLTIVIDDVPEDAIRLRLGLAEGGPRTLLVVPASLDARVRAVVELGLLAPPSEETLELLEEARRPIGMAIEAALARSRLEETRDELQQQQEELRQTNEELEAQTRLLKSSEQRLQVQQEELRQTNEELESQTRELEAAQNTLRHRARELEEAGHYKSQFLANVSHELRTPLNSMLILSRLLRDNKHGNLNEEQVEWAATIHSAGSDLLALINDVLDLSRVEAGKLDLTFEPVSPASVAEDLRGLFGEVGRKKDLRFEVVVDDSAPPEVITDKQRLSQILKNLVANAFKFTEHGGVTVRFEGREPDQLAISVLDTGIGISREKLSHIFEAFQQEDGTTSRRYGGTGLGLSIARELTHLLGGTITVSSVKGEGSMFTLVLPPGGAVEIPPQPEPEAPLDDRERWSPGDPAILVVADDRQAIHALVDLARERDYRTLVGRTAEEALWLAERFQPTGIMVDLAVGGSESLLAQLGSRPPLRNIPVHVLSAPGDAVDALRLGAVGVLVKPAGAQELSAAMERINALAERHVKRLLLVEDCEDEREQLQRLLGGLDLDIVVASTGADALANLKQEPFDCVILDLRLPDMTGFEVLDGIDDLGIPLPPIIVYTGQPLSEAEEARLRRRTESIIVKGAHSRDRLLDEATLFLHRVRGRRPSTTDAPPGDPGLEGRRVLLVDDDMRNVFAVSTLLERHGAEVVVGRTGREGLTRLEQDPAIDLVLMDIMMPEMDGFEAMKRIREDGTRADLPIIALTARATRQDAERCLAAGASDYLAKPIDPDRLLSLIRVWLSR